jgi:hypothetical protein
MSGDWKDGLRDQLEDFVDSLVVKGASQSDVYDAIVEEIGNLRTAYERDPDPAEDRPGARRRNRRTSGPAPCREDNKKGRGEIAPTFQTSLFTPVPVHPWSKVRQATPAVANARLEHSPATPMSYR